MICIFTTLKPHRGQTQRIQSNALRSWTLLEPKPAIIIFGNEEGTAQAAQEFGARHIADVARNEFGTPLISDMFHRAQALAPCRILCYVNADIILMGDFISAIRRVSRRFRRFLMVGRRWNLDLNEPLDFSPGWEDVLRRRIQADGKLAEPDWLDYFAFPRGLWGEIPPLAIGRTAWDNWLVYRAREVLAPVVDATEATTVVHQNHDYGHIPGGQEAAWNGPEARSNRELVGDYRRLFTIEDATWLLTAEGLKHARTQAHRRRARETWPVRHPKLDAILRGARWSASLPLRLPGAIARRLRRRRPQDESRG